MTNIYTTAVEASLQKSLRPTSVRRVAVACALAVLIGCGSGAAAVPDIAVTPAADPAPDAAPDAAPDPAADDVVGSVVEMLIGQAAASGVGLDQQCVVDAIELLGDADLELMAAAASEASADATIPELSPEGEAIGEGVTACVIPNDDVGEPADAATVAEAVAVVVSEEGDAVDQRCLTDQFSALGVNELRALIDEGAATDNPLAERTFLAVWQCFLDEEASSADSAAVNATAPANAAPDAQETVFETPVGWPTGVPVLPYSEDFYISGDPMPPGQFDVIMRVQTPAIFQSAFDEWAEAVGLACIVELDETEAQPCGALADGTMLSVQVDQEALHSPQPRFSLLFTTP